MIRKIITDLFMVFIGPVSADEKKFFKKALNTLLDAAEEAGAKGIEAAAKGAVEGMKK